MCTNSFLPDLQLRKRHSRPVIQTRSHTPTLPYYSKFDGVGVSHLQRRILFEFGFHETCFGKMSEFICVASIPHRIAEDRGRPVVHHRPKADHRPCVGFGIYVVFICIAANGQGSGKGISLRKSRQWYEKKKTLAKTYTPAQRDCLSTGAAVPCLGSVISRSERDTFASQLRFPARTCGLGSRSWTV